MSALSVGVDLGGTHARVALVDAQGKVLQSRKQKVTDRAVEQVVETLALAVEALLQEAGHPQTRGVGVGVAGQLRGDVVAVAPNLGWREAPFGALLSARLQRPVTLVNDLKAAAWGELKAGCAQGARDTFTVFVGTGVGSAIIANGQLVLGATGVAGEFGHIRLVHDGRPCGCGRRGCLEAYVGGANLTAWMAEVGLSGSAGDLEALVGQGVAAALPLYAFVRDQLSLAIANQVTVLNPAQVVLGGGVLSRSPGLVRAIEEGIARDSGATSVAGLKVTLAQLGDDSGLVGAALLA